MKFIINKITTKCEKFEIEADNTVDAFNKILSNKIDPIEINADMKFRALTTKDYEQAAEDEADWLINNLMFKHEEA